MTRASSRLQGTPELSTPSPEAEISYLESLYQRESFDVRKLGDRGLGVLYFASHEPVSEVPLILIPGFSAPRAVYFALAAKMADTGTNTAIYRPQRKQPLGAVLSPHHMRNVLKLQQQTVKNVMETVREETGITDFALAGHSMGNSIGTGVAHHVMLEKPRKDLNVVALVSDAGAGLDVPEATTPWQSVKRHATRLPNVIRHELTQAPRMIEVAPGSMKREAIAHVRDLGRLAREGFQVMVYPEVIEKLEQLRADSDIRIGALLPEKDQFFYADDVEARSGHLFDVPATRIPDAYHVHANTHPDEHSVYLTDLLERLERREEAA